MVIKAPKCPSCGAEIDRSLKISSIPIGKIENRPYRQNWQNRMKRCKQK